ncbi:MAG: response regulator transcription factor [Bacteroidota bacterium]|nr:response regulator transcription factor [Bacteroidota bacterium]
MKVLIADDHQIVREGLKRILHHASDIDEVSEAENAQQLLDLLETQHWDVVVLDINMPGKSGLDVLKEIKHQYPKLPVLILSMYPESQFAVRMIKQGASGYLTKASAASELIQAIRKVYQGGKYISPSVADKLAEALGSETDKPAHESLSDREFQVFRFIATGMTVGEIAVELTLSVKTISTYRTKILEKMKLRNNADIVQYAVRFKLVE